MSRADKIEGSSKSLNKTIRELKKFLSDNVKRPVGVKLRPFLNERIADLAEHWYKRGVRRGHIQSYREWKTTEKVSRKLYYEDAKDFYDGREREVRVTSRVKK
jgi:DNA phosphorothioation-dependent restriction protein DptG